MLRVAWEAAPSASPLLSVSLSDNKDVHASFKMTCFHEGGNISLNRKDSRTGMRVLTESWCAADSHVELQ